MGTVLFLSRDLWRKGGKGMEQQIIRNGTSITVHLPDEVDHCSSQQLRGELEKLIRQRNIRKILFDFGDTVFMDSSGIGMLLGSYKTMRFMGGTIQIINAGERMRKILMLSGVDKVVDIYQGLPKESNLV